MNTLWNSLVIAKKCKGNQPAQIISGRVAVARKNWGDRNHLYPCQKHHIRTTIQPTIESSYVLLCSITSFHVSLVCFISQIICIFRWPPWFHYIFLCLFRVQYCFSFVWSFRILSFVFFYLVWFPYSCSFLYKFSFHRLFQSSLRKT